MTPDFETPRLRVADWAASLADAALRHALVQELAALLTPAVLQHLPEPLQIAPPGTGIEDWIDARAAEAQVLTLRETPEGGLAGLLILAEMPGDAASRDLHLGYLLAEHVWGQGLATELLTGLVAALNGRAGLRLVGGVGRDNPASARVLEKAGFRLCPAQPSGDTLFYERLV